MSSLLKYQHVTPPLRVFSGEQCFGSLERELKRLGVQRAMVFCGNTLGREGSPLDLVRAALPNSLAGVFTGVRAHSPVSDVELACQALRDTGADGVIAIGGGSAIVTARAATILLAEGRDAAALATVTGADGKLISPRLEASKLPQIIIPTTPTTAIVRAGAAVFDAASQSRLALFDPKTRVQSVFINPDMLDSAPERLVVSASLNTLSMAIEGLMSRRGDPISDGQLMQALRLTVQHLGHRKDLDAAARGDLVVAAMLSGQGTDHSGAGVVTVLGHAIGNPFHIENGIANAIVLPHAIRYNAVAAQGGLAKVGAAMGLHHSDADVLLEGIVGGLKTLLGSLGVPSRLRDVGVPREALADVAKDAMGDWFLGGNPRPITDASQIEELVGEAW